MCAMPTKTELQYLGFLNTPLLWQHTPLLELSQLEITQTHHKTFRDIAAKKYRLGHLVEQFVFHELEQQNSIKVHAKNIQIKRQKQTIGELDCLLTLNSNPIHLEIVYKFYLYDESVGYTELEHWIGPNRNDSFIEKITKLKHKQLPLLYASETSEVINNLQLNVSDIVQKVYFKAQLFVPIHLENKPLRTINNACIEGYYLAYKDLHILKGHQFYIPEKLDWLLKPHISVNWLQFETAQQVILPFITQHKSPLCWSLSPKGTLQKLFVVWW